jgi:hypothetical protein
MPMWLAAVFTAELALAGPNGLQALHNPVTEKTQQEQMIERLGGAPTVRLRRKPHAPLTAEEKRAAAWRADHLTCASPKGRTREQFETECKLAASP